MKIRLVPIQFFPFAAFAMKTKDLGSIIQVSFSAKEIALFNSSFPCSGIPARDVFFQFEKKTGDLVDMSEHLREVENGSAVSALCDEAKSFFEKIKKRACNLGKLSFDCIQFNQSNHQNL